MHCKAEEPTCRLQTFIMSRGIFWSYLKVVFQVAERREARPVAWTAIVWLLPVSEVNGKYWGRHGR
jgi:hypothetical protein